MDTPAIQVRDLHKKFGHVTAVKGLSFEVGQGSIHGFLGPNGAGKSTVIRTLIGALKPTAGSVKVLGQDPIQRPTILRSVGYVPGDGALWPNLTGMEVFRAMESLRTIKSDQVYESELIDAFDLDPSKKVRDYSTGNRRKVSLIAALTCRPKLLILDEPTAGLDPIMEQVFIAETRKYRSNGGSVLLSSHILSEVDTLCDYVTVIKEGEAVASNEVSFLRKISAHKISAHLPSVPTALKAKAEFSFYNGLLEITTEAEAVPEILKIIIEAGGEDIISTPASLEEIFLRNFTSTVRSTEADFS